MSYTYSIKDKGNYLLVSFAGEDSYEESLKLWKDIIKACEKYNCFNILGVGESTPLSAMDAFDHEKIFKDVGVSLKHRIAWVEKNPEAREMIEFTETVLLNRGFVNGKVFDDLSEAKKWLLKKKDV